MGNQLGRKAEVIVQQLLQKTSFFFQRNKQIECSQNTLRCESAFNSPHYKYILVGKDTPQCCASHLVELILWLKQLLDEHEIPYFSLWGTHIGAIRHKGLIPWDTDVDLGVELKYRDQVLELLKTEITPTGYYINCDEENIIRLQYSESNTLHVDIEIWTPLETNPDIIFFQDESYVEIALSSIYPLIELPFYNFTIKAPHSDQYLKDYYGPTLFTHGYKKYDVFSKGEFPLTDVRSAKIDETIIDGQNE